MTGSKQTRFRSRSKTVDQATEKIQDKLKNLTSHRKTSLNQTLNFAIILAKNHLQEIEKEIDQKKETKKSIEKQIKATENQLQKTTEVF